MATMKAMVMRKPGDPTVMQLERVPKPELTDPDKVLVKVSYAGVNYIDTYQRSGQYSVQVPFVLGCEGSGTVEAIGAKARAISGLEPGDKVAFLGSSCYAEYVLMHHSVVAKLPEPVTEAEGAALLLQGMSAAYLVNDTVDLQRGMSCVVYAAAGGAGSLTAQMARAKGAFVIGVVGSESKVAEAGKHCDAVLVVDYKDEASRRRFVERVLELTSGAGADVAYDSVGRDSYKLTLQILAKGGLFVSWGSASGPIEGMSPHDFGPRLLKFTSQALFQYIDTPEGFKRLAGTAFGMLGKKLLTLKIHKVYPLEEAAEAHADIQSRATVGKLLLKV